MFFLQFFQFVMKVVFTHGDSVEFLLESDCQCSFEVSLLFSYYISMSHVGFSST